VPVPEGELPIELPKVEKYEPTDTGESPLANIDDWVNTKCPSCGGAGKRETDTMPNWAGSSWYYLRYVDPNNDKAFAGGNLLKYWIPVDVYNGGMEHTTLHLLYSRFWHKFMFDQGLVPSSEPYAKRTSHGVVLGEGGVKMSKSRGNVINPDDVVGKYGTDTLRLYEMFMGPFENAMPWSDTSLKGVSRFLARVWGIISRLKESVVETDTEEVNYAMHVAIKRVGEGTDRFRFNTAVAALMELLNTIDKEAGVSEQLLDNYILLLSPYAPHIAEELWKKLGHSQSVMKQDWPRLDDMEVLGQGTVKLPVQVNGKVRGEIETMAGMSQDEAESAAREVGNVVKYIEQGEVVKVVYIEGRMLNFVVK
jgi:leucyl-tRNA synthetase